MSAPSAPSLELLKLTETKNIGYCMNIPTNTTDGQMEQNVAHIGVLVGDIHSLDLTNCIALTLIQAAPSPIAATDRLEFDIDVQDKRRTRPSSSTSRRGSLGSRRRRHRSEQNVRSGDRPSSSSSSSSRNRSRSRRSRSKSTQLTQPTQLAPFNHFHNPLAGSLSRKVIPASWMHSFSRIRVISLAGCHRINDQSIRSLVTTMPLLDTVNLEHCARVSDSSVTRLISLIHLKWLNLSSCIRVTGNGMKMLFGTVEHLLLSRCHMIDDEMILGSMRVRKNYGMKKTPNQGIVFDRVKNQSRRARPIRTLHLAECLHVTDESMLRLNLHHCSTLTSLNLSRCTFITDISLGRILSFLSAPLISLNLSYLPNVTNQAVASLRKNKGNRREAGSDFGGKLRWLKEIDVSNSGCDSLDILSWLVESATELISLGIGRSNKVLKMSSISTKNKLEKKVHIGQYVSMLRRLQTLIVGDEHVESVELEENWKKRLHVEEREKDEKKEKVVDNGLSSSGTFILERVLSQALSKQQYLQYKYGTHSFTYQLPRNHPEMILNQREAVTTRQSSLPTGCEHRNSRIAINGSLKGFYGDTVLDEQATTTITGLEKQAWWEVDIGRREKVGVIKIILPEQHPPSYLTPNQYPLWIFCYREPLPVEMIGAAVCPSRDMLHYSVFSKRLEWDPTKDVNRSIRVDIPATVPSFRVLRLQQETTERREGRCLSLCEVQLLPMRLQRVVYNNDNDNNDDNNQCVLLVDSHLSKHNPHLENKIAAIEVKKQQTKEDIYYSEESVVEELCEKIQKRDQSQPPTALIPKHILVHVRLGGLAAKYLNGRTGVIVRGTSDRDRDEDKSDRVRVRLDGSEKIVTVKKVNTFDIQKLANQSRLLSVFPKLSPLEGGV